MRKKAKAVRFVKPIRITKNGKKNLKKRGVDKMFYDVCPECGASLDPGEKCDCIEERKVKENDGQRICDSGNGSGYGGRTVFETACTTKG